ncbi:MvaI/BcnI family restriction endonuclease [Photobacterium kishitanii]|nr:MvaI/BcnI family restriction endonuclease [Photobacterium kishitanii]
MSNMGEIKSLRNGNTGVGYTYEESLSLDENNRKDADFESMLEVKTFRAPAKSKLTLFTLSPVDKVNGGSVMRSYLNKFGSTSSRSGSLSLHTTIKAGRRNTYKKKLRFSVQVDREHEIFRIVVEDFKTGALLDDSVSYDFHEISTALERKLKLLALTGARVRKDSNGEYFTYLCPVIYKLKSFEQFVSVFEKGDIVLDVRIGTYVDGRPHDHGTAWRITHRKLKEIFYVVELD